MSTPAQDSWCGTWIMKLCLDDVPSVPSPSLSWLLQPGFSYTMSMFFCCQQQLLWQSAVTFWEIGGLQCLWHLSSAQCAELSKSQEPSAALLALPGLNHDFGQITSPWSASVFSSQAFIIINTELPRRRNGRLIKLNTCQKFFILRFEGGHGNDVSIFCSALSGTFLWPQQNESHVHTSLLSCPCSPSWCQPAQTMAGLSCSIHGMWPLNADTSLWALCSSGSSPVAKQQGLSLYAVICCFS